MEEIFFNVVFAVVLLAVFASAFHGMKLNRQFPGELKRIAAELRLTFQSGSSRWEPWAEGSLDGRNLMISRHLEDDSNHTRIELALPLASRPFVGAEGIGSRLSARLGSPDIQIGVADFDAAVVIQGTHVPDIVARSDHRSRRAIRRLVTTQGGELREGALRRRIQANASRAEIVATIDRMREVARCLTRAGDRPAASLLGNALTDPDPDLGYRLRCLDLLFEHYPRSAQAKDARRIGIHADHPAEIRFLVARQLGEDGLPLVRELMASDALPDDLRAIGRALLGDRAMGRLAVSEEEADRGGELAVVAARDGALSKVKS